MGEFVQRGCCLVLVMAVVSQRREVRVVDVAIGNHIQSGERVGQHVRFTIPVHIGAEVFGGPRVCGLCFFGNRLQPRRDELTSRSGGRLEVFREFRRRAC